MISSPWPIIIIFQVPSEYVADTVQSEVTVYGPESLTGKIAPPQLNVNEREVVPWPSKENVPAAASLFTRTPFLASTVVAIRKSPGDRTLLAFPLEFATQLGN